MSDVKPLMVSIRNGALCGKDHPHTPFRQLKRAGQAPGSEWSHWASCPETGEPIMLVVTDRGDPPLPAHVAVGLTWARGATPETRELAIKEFCALLKMPCPKNGKVFRRAVLMAAVMGQVMLQE